jgi:apolipoprotein N-acyltransferase
MWWLGQMVTDPGNEWIIFAMFAFVSTAMAAYYGVAAMVMRWLLTRKQRWTLWLVPFAWLGFEFLHEFNTPAPYPWLEIALSVSDFSWFIQTADIWGQYGITAALVLTALGIVAPFEFAGSDAKLKLRSDKFHRFVVPGVALAFVILSCIYGIVRISQVEARETGDGPVVAGIQGNLSQEVKVKKDPMRLPNSFGEHLQLSKQAAEQDAELICWAETMLFYGATREGLPRSGTETARSMYTNGVPSRQLLNEVALTPEGRRYRPSYVDYLRAKIAHDIQTPMLVGTLTDIPEEDRTEPWKQETYDLRKYNTAMAFDEQGRVTASYDKRYLVPGGEYIPHEDVEFIRKIMIDYAEGLQGYASRVERGKRLTTFRLPSKSERLDGRDWFYTATICYEYAWPGCYPELHEKPDRYPDFHVNISNEGWFKQSAELDQAVDYCQFRCIESRVPMVRATNTGVTCSIDAAGRVRQVLTVDGEDREVQGILLMRPAVLEDPRPTIFVSMVKRGLGWLSLVVIFAIMPMMVVGRFKLWRKRKRIKQAEADHKEETGSSTS